MSCFFLTVTLSGASVERCASWHCDLLMLLGPVEQCLGLSGRDLVADAYF